MRKRKKSQKSKTKTDWRLKRLPGKLQAHFTGQLINLLTYHRAPFPFFSYFYCSPKKRRYSCNLQIIHGSLRLLSRNRVDPSKYLMRLTTSGATQIIGWPLVYLIFEI